MLQGERQPPRDVRLGQVGGELQRPLAGQIGLLQVGFRPVRVEEEEGAAFGHAGVGAGVVRVERQRHLELLQCRFDAGSLVLEEAVASPEVVLVGAHVGGRGAEQRLRRFFPEPHLEGGDDPLDDLLLEGEHVRQRAVERLGPELASQVGGAQPDLHGEAVVGLSEGARQDGGDAEGLAHRRDVVLAPVAKRDAARNDAQPLDARERADQLFGQAVADVSLVGFGAAVLSGSTAIDGVGIRSLPVEQPACDVPLSGESTVPSVPLG